MQSNIKTYMVLWSRIVGKHKRKNITVIQHFQNKVLRCIVNAPCYICINDLHRDLGVNTAKREIENIATKDNIRLRDHVNIDALSLTDPIGMERRLKRRRPSDLIGSPVLF